MTLLFWPAKYPTKTSTLRFVSQLPGGGGHHGRCVQRSNFGGYGGVQARRTSQLGVLFGGRGGRGGGNVRRRQDYPLLPGGRCSAAGEQ